MGGPPLSSSPGTPSQNSFNHTTFGMGLDGQPPRQFANVMNMGYQGTTEIINSFERSLKQIPGDAQAQNFNMGSRGRKPDHRGGGRFAGSRDRGQSK